MKLIIKIKKNFFSLKKRKRKIRKITCNLSREPIGLNEKQYLKDKKKFLELAQKKVEFFAAKYSFEYNRIFIKNQKTRWGSCSANKNLNFNYRIFLLEEKYMDYVIVHEICHLKHMNHSKDFWKEVEKEIPDYLQLRKEMKKYYFVN